MLDRRPSEGTGARIEEHRRFLDRAEAGENSILKRAVCRHVCEFDEVHRFGRVEDRKEAEQ